MGELENLSTNADALESPVSSERLEESYAPSGKQEESDAAKAAISEQPSDDSSVTVISTSADAVGGMDDQTAAPASAE